jgi:hypothetical protein
MIPIVTLIMVSSFVFDKIFVNLKKGSENTLNFLHRLLIFPSDCSNFVANGLPTTAFIQEGYMRLKPLLYPCTIEFSLMCLTVSLSCFSIY